jgi:hypothetical protein
VNKKVSRALQECLLPYNQQTLNGLADYLRANGYEEAAAAVLQPGQLIVNDQGYGTITFPLARIGESGSAE